MTKELLIAIIKSNLPKLGIDIDCSRFEESYDGYRDSRDWYLQYADKIIDLDRYLSHISKEKVQKMVDIITVKD